MALDPMETGSIPMQNDWKLYSMMKRETKIYHACQACSQIEEGY